MKILITAGPTREYIDPVRFISNPATGTLGYLLAKKAKEKGHSVVMISGPCSLHSIRGIKKINVETAIEMEKAVEKEFPLCEVLIMTAAVSDWRPEKRFTQKIKIKKPWILKLIPNPDILKGIAKKKNKNQIVVGFALESENMVENAKKKLKEKKLDLIVANSVQNFGNPREKKEIYLIFSDERIKKISCTKNQLASILIKEIENLKKTS